jgi:benzylsuccinate CoA-transferase BbsE subunit
MSELRTRRSNGPLEGLCVVELASEAGAYAGKLLADYGAEVLLVEPPGGHPTRRYAPFADELDESHPDRSLWFWHYNTTKLGVEVDLDTPSGAARFRRLVDHADIVLEAEPADRLRTLGLDYAQICGPASRTVWVSLTPFGRDDLRREEPFTDLTVTAGGGMAWSCGYDNHDLPPMSCLGNQGYQTACVWAAIGALTAIRARASLGRGQLVDVSMHAAANISTEQATHWWLVAGKCVQRQTGRHASHVPTEPIVQVDRDGREVHTGFAPHTAGDLTRLVGWIHDVGLRDEFPLTALLELAIEQGGIDLRRLNEDAFTQESYRTAREAVALIASKLAREEFFLDGQARGFAVGMILAPDEALDDPHLASRGYPVALVQPQLARPVVHAGLPVRFLGTPGSIRPAPGLGAHQYVVDTSVPPAPERSLP